MLGAHGPRFSGWSNTSPNYDKLAQCFWFLKCRADKNHHSYKKYADQHILLSTERYMDAIQATPKISKSYGCYWIFYCLPWIAVKVL